MVGISGLSLPGVVEITTQRFFDERGFFSETYNEQDFLEAGIDVEWVQDNFSYSEEENVLRGLHYQLPPFAQAKLVRVSAGRALDVVVDIRQGAPTFGQWASLELSAEHWNQMFIPAGFAHGFRTLEPKTEFQYKTSTPYSAEHDRAIRYDDPAIGIDWELGATTPLMSGKDHSAPLLKDAEIGFVYTETP